MEYRTMNQNGVNKTVESIVDREEKEKDKWAFFTETGKRIPLSPMSPYLLEKVRNSVDFPAEPTYEIKTVTGIVEEHPLKKEDATTDEEKAKWEEYEVKRDEANAEIAIKMLDLICVKGVAIEVPDNEDWIEVQELIGINVPRGNKIQLRLHYVQTEVIESKDDLQRLTKEYLEKIGLRQEVVEDVEESFPDKLPRDEPEGTDESTETEESGSGREPDRDGGRREYSLIPDERLDV